MKANGKASKPVVQVIEWDGRGDISVEDVREFITAHGPIVQIETAVKSSGKFGGEFGRVTVLCNRQMAASQILRAIPRRPAPRWEIAVPEAQHQEKD